MSDIVDRAAEALRNGAIPSGPPADVLAATVAAVEMRAGTIHTQRRKRIMRIVRYGSLTGLAAGVLIAVEMLWVSPTTAYAQVRKVLDNANRAVYVKVVIKHLHPGPEGQRSPNLVTYFRKDAIRQETEGRPTYAVIDFAARKQITFDTKTRSARLHEMTDERARTLRWFTGRVYDPLGVLGTVKDAVVEELPRGPEDNPQVRCYRIRNGKTPAAERQAQWILWVDTGTNLPVRLRSDGYVAGQEGIFELADIEYQDWNKEFDPKLFSMDVPEGYTLIGPNKPAENADQPSAPSEDSSAPPPTAFVVFRQAVDNVEKAKSVRVVGKKADKDGRPKDWSLTEYVRVDAVRRESGDRIEVTNLSEKTRLVIDRAAKSVRVFKLDDKATQRQASTFAEWTNFLSALAKDKTLTVKELPGKEIDGHKFKVYGITSAENATVAKPRVNAAVLIDAETGLIRRLADTVGDGDIITLDYTWNEEIDPKLFSLDVPEGYKLEEPKPDAGKK